MMKLPMSDYMWNYYQQTGITFTDSEQATILWNSAIPLPKAEILDALKEIADQTEDGSLKTQIYERLDVERKAAQRFRENDGRYFFICTSSENTLEEEWDREKQCGSSYFITLEAAIVYGKEESEGIFTVEKKIFEDCLAEDNPEDDQKVTDVLDTRAWYTKDGVPIHCSCFPYDLGVTGRIGGYKDPSRFENAYIPLQNPFEIGDIVRDVVWTRPAVVQTRREAWNRRPELNTHFGDSNLRVGYLWRNGEMGHDHPHILSLEKIDRWEDEAEWELLQAASWLIRGEGEIEGFFDYYQRNLEHKRNR